MFQIYFTSLPWKWLDALHSVDRTELEPVHVNLIVSLYFISRETFILGRNEHFRARLQAISLQIPDFAGGLIHKTKKLPVNVKINMLIRYFELFWFWLKGCISWLLCIHISLLRIWSIGYMLNMVKIYLTHREFFCCSFQYMNCSLCAIFLPYTTN